MGSQSARACGRPQHAFATHLGARAVTRVLVCVLGADPAIGRAAIPLLARVVQDHEVLSDGSRSRSVCYWKAASVARRRYRTSSVLITTTNKAMFKGHEDGST